MTHSPTVTLLTVSNNNVDAWYWPRHQVHSTVGAGLTYDGTYPICEPVGINDYVIASVAHAGDDETIDIALVIEV